MLESAGGWERFGEMGGFFDGCCWSDVSCEGEHLGCERVGSLESSSWVGSSDGNGGEGSVKSGCDGGSGGEGEGRVGGGRVDSLGRGSESRERTRSNVGGCLTRRDELGRSNRASFRSHEGRIEEESGDVVDDGAGESSDLDVGIDRHLEEGGEDGVAARENHLVLLDLTLDLLRTRHLRPFSDGLNDVSLGSELVPLVGCSTFLLPVDPGGGDEPSSPLSNDRAEHHDELFPDHRTRVSVRRQNRRRRDSNLGSKLISSCSVELNS